MFKRNLFSVLKILLRPFAREKAVKRIEKVWGFRTVWRKFWVLLLTCVAPKLIDTPGGKVHFSPWAAADLCISEIFLGSFEPFSTELFQRIVRRGNTVVDLGAHMGYYSLLAAKLVGEEGKVYAFEPDPQNYDLLKKNVEVNKYNNIIPVPKAVSNKCGVVQLFGNISGGQCIYPPPGAKLLIEVEAITLDEFFKDKPDHIDFMKIDVEGAEIEAIEGMDKLIAKNKNLKMFVEFYPFGLERAGRSPEEFFAKLLGYGFSIYGVDEKEKRIRKFTDVSQALEMRKIKAGVNLYLTRSEDLVTRQAE